MKKVKALRNLTDTKASTFIPKGTEWEVSNAKAKELVAASLAKEVKEEYESKEEKAPYTTK